MADWLVAGAIGLVSGMLSGAFGIGGGIITTPAIRLLLGAPALIAVGTPLPVIVPGALTGAVSYTRAGLADVRSGLLMAAAGVPLTVFGAWLASRLGGTVVLLGTAVLIIWAAADMLVQAASKRDGASAPGDDGDQAARPRGVVLAGIGALTGLYSGFLGLGGGFVIVPLLTRWLRFPIKRALGTSLVTVTILAVPGTITHALLGNIDWSIALGLVVGVVPGALIGARFSIGAQDRHIRVAFAVMLIIVALWLGVSEIAGML
jgi:uncharacterized membrane protein YfcA